MTVEEEALVAEVRRMADEPLPDTYTDQQILDLVTALGGKPEAAAARIWQTKAGSYAKLVNTSESGSSRSMGDLYKNALAMGKYYSDLANPTVPVVPETTYPMTIDITR